MKKAKKMDLVKKGIINLKEEFVPTVILKKPLSKKLIKRIPSSVIKAHLKCEYSFEDSPIIDPLLFFIPAFAKDPSLAACQLLESIRNNVLDDDIRSFIHKKDIEEFMRLLQRSNSKIV